MKFVPPYPVNARPIPDDDRPSRQVLVEEFFGPIIRGEETASILVSVNVSHSPAVLAKTESIRRGRMDLIDLADIWLTHGHVGDVSALLSNEEIAARIDAAFPSPSPTFARLRRAVDAEGRDLRRFEVGDLVVRFDPDDWTSDLRVRRRLVFALDETGVFRCLGSFRPRTDAENEENFRFFTA